MALAGISAKATVVLPSYRDGIPRLLLETAAMGKAVITTDTVGCRVVVDDWVTGLLVPVKDAEALAHAMVHLLHNPVLRARMEQAGRDKRQREFRGYLRTRPWLAWPPSSILKTIAKLWILAVEVFFHCLGPARRSCTALGG